MNPNDIPDEPGFLRSFMILIYWLYHANLMFLCFYMFWIAIKLWAL